MTGHASDDGDAAKEADAVRDAGTPFWQFSLATYAKPDVATTCLSLQDEYGVDVNVLLFVAWLGANGRRVNGDDVVRILARTRDWSRDVVGPLRAARRRLNAPNPLVPPGAAETFRTEVKRLELEAERLQQNALYTLASEFGTASDLPVADLVRTAIEALARASGRELPPAAIDTLVAAATT